MNMRLSVECYIREKEAQRASFSFRCRETLALSAVLDWSAPVSRHISRRRSSMILEQVEHDFGAGEVFGWGPAP